MERQPAWREYIVGKYEIINDTSPSPIMASTKVTEACGRSLWNSTPRVRIDDPLVRNDSRRVTPPKPQITDVKPTTVSATRTAGNRMRQTGENDARMLSRVS